MLRLLVLVRFGLAVIVKIVGLMWSHFLINYLLGYKRRMITNKDTCYVEIALCAQNIVDAMWSSILNIPV